MRGICCGEDTKQMPSWLEWVENLWWLVLWRKAGFECGALVEFLTGRFILLTWAWRQMLCAGEVKVGSSTSRSVGVVGWWEGVGQMGKGGASRMLLRMVGWFAFDMFCINLFFESRKFYCGEIKWDKFFSSFPLISSQNFWDMTWQLLDSQKRSPLLWYAVSV